MDIGVGRDESAQPYVAQPDAGVATRTSAGARSRAWLRANWLTAFVLAWIVAFGFSLRVTNVNWDKGQHLHPDERFLMIVTGEIRAPSSVGEYFDSSKSPLNPYQTQGSFVYGTFPLFLNKTVAEWLDQDADGSTHKSADIFLDVLKPFGVDPTTASGSRTFDGGYNSQTVGRVLSAIFDVFTILLVFEFGRLLWGKRIGLLAAALYSISVLSIQYSHFFGSETFLIFFVTATIYFSVRIWKYGTAVNYVFAGLAYGLALSTKLSAIPVILVIGLAVLMRMWPQLEALYARMFGQTVPWRRGEPLPERVHWEGLYAPIAGTIITLFFTGLLFRIFQPYAFNGPGFFDVLSINGDKLFSLSGIIHLEFLKPTNYFDFSEKYKNDIEGLINLQKGQDFPPNIQWIDRPKFLFPAKGIFLWGWGVTLTLATAGGALYIGWRLWKRDFSGLIPLFWCVFLFWFVGRGFTPTIRYFLPMYPMMAAIAALGLVRLWDFAATDRARELVPRRLAAYREWAQPALRGVAVVAVLGGLLWALAFLNVYRATISRVEASKWIGANLPKGSRLTSNEWDDGLPLSLPGVSPADYPGVRLKPYAQDNEQKVQEFVAGLDEADYVVESSNRVYATVPRIPARYPNMYLYYKYLFDGTLGFEKVAEFTNYPSIFGIEIPDQSSEESFTVYDHPKVTIWKKTDAYSHERAIELLNIDKAATAIPIPPKDGTTNAGLYKPDLAAKVKDGGTWSDIFSTDNLINRFPLLTWIIVMELAAIALVPFAVVTFRGLPDRGYLLTKPLGILGLACFVYFPAAYGLTHFTRGAIAAVLVLMLAAGAVMGYAWRAQMREWWRAHWRFVLTCEAIFLGAFLFSYWIRLQNPDLWHPYNGGEKPMDFAYLQGVIKSEDLTIGPIDVWNAGGYLNYYWFGQYIAATVTKLTGIVPEVAYNLIVPMFFALSAAAVFSVAYNLAEGTRRLMRRGPGLRAISARGPVICGLLAIFLVMIAGNLRAVDVLEQKLSLWSPWHSDIPFIGGVVAIVGGFKAMLFHDTVASGGEASLHRLFLPGGYDWWAPSRALTTVNPQEVQPITEFPFWTFLFADLHAHLMAIPFALTGLGVGLGLVTNFTRLNVLGRARETMRSREVASWAMVVTLALIVGAQRWINSWDYPPFLLLGLAAILISERAKNGDWRWQTLGLAAAKSAVFVGLSFVLFAKISHNYAPQPCNKTAPHDICLMGTGFHQSDQTTALEDYFSHFGIPLFILGGLALFMLWRAVTRTGLLRKMFFGRNRHRTLLDTAPALTAIVLGAGMLIFLGARNRSGVTVLAAVGLAAVVVLGYRTLRSRDPVAPLLLFVYAMVAMGLGLSGGVEVFTLDNDIGRMNTVFKFYLHVWELFGIAAAFALWYLFAVMRPQASFLRRAGRLDAAFVRVPRYAYAAVVVVLLLLALVFPYFGTRARIHDRFDPSLGTTNDGLAFMDVVHDYAGGPYPQLANPASDPQDLALTRDAIDWARENIKGSPTTIEAIGPSYRSMASRFAIYAGLPTVTGWRFHQEQQRQKFQQVVRQRQQDVDLFYTTTDVITARKILNRYDIDYVIVGDEERYNYPAAGLRKFDNGLDGSLERVYANAAISIYRAIPKDQLQQQPQAQTAP
jgi:YYY domain-containing protein